MGVTIILSSPSYRLTCFIARFDIKQPPLRCCPCGEFSFSLLCDVAIADEYFEDVFDAAEAGFGGAFEGSGDGVGAHGVGGGHQYAFDGQRLLVTVFREDG